MGRNWGDCRFPSTLLQQISRGRMLPTERPYLHRIRDPNRADIPHFPFGPFHLQPNPHLDPSGQPPGEVPQHIFTLPTIPPTRMPPLLSVK